MKKRMLASLLGMAVLLQSSGFTTVASSEASVQLHEISCENEQVGICSEKPMHLICTNEDENEYSHGSIITKQFEIDSYYDLDSYEVAISTYTGVDITKKPIIAFNEKNVPIIEIEFIVLDTCEIGEICLVLQPLSSSDNSITDQMYYEKKIYCYHDSEYDYVSTVSLDSLSDDSERLHQYLLDIERQGECIENEKHDIIPIKGNDGITRYSHELAGYISWTDSANGIHSADGVKVELYTVNGTTETLVGSTHTTSSGGYSISFSGSNTSQNVKFKVLSEGTNVTVKQASSPYETYSYESSTFQIWGFTKASYTAPNLTNAGKSLSIQQAMTLANNYIYSLDASLLPNIDVAFPDNGGSRYSSTLNKIYIEPDDEFDWDVIQHEYGHYVQDQYNIENSPGGSHSSLQNLADARNNKSQGVRLAWGEGWATYFAINLQKEMNASSLYIPNVGDAYYQDVYPSNTYSWDVEYLASERRLGEANESTVCAVLYDMTDGYNLSGDDDNVWYANDNIWDITKNSNCTTLSEFLAAFYVAGFLPYPVSQLGSTLTAYNVAANPSTPTGLNTNTPTFYWTAQGGSVNFPNNRFRLVFLDSNYSVILNTSYTTSTYQQLTASQWTQIQNASTVRYYYVETEQTSTPSTGPYRSILKQV